MRDSVLFGGFDLLLFYFSTDLIHVELFDLSDEVVERLFRKHIRLHENDFHWKERNKQVLSSEAVKYDKLTISK